MAALALIVITYGVTPACIALMLQALLRPNRPDCAGVLVIALGLTPLLFGRLVVWELRVVPGLSDTVYVMATLLAVAMLTGAAWLVCPRENRPALPAPSRLWSVVAGLGALAGLVVLWLPSIADTMTSIIFTHLIGSGIGWEKTFGGWGLVLLLTLAGLTAARLFSRRFNRTTDETQIVLGLVDRWFPWLLGLMLSALATVTVLTCLGGYLKETDSVQHMKAALLIWDAADTSIYPFVPAQADGSYATSSHPLGHHGSFIWNYMIQGAALPDLNKLVALYPYLATIGVVVFGFPRLPLVARLAAACVMCATPAYVIQTVNVGIDAPRLFAILAGCWLLARGIELRNWRWFLGAGLVMGLSINIHSINLFFSFCACAALIAGYRDLPQRWVRNVAILGGVTVAMGSDQYVVNMLAWGQLTYASQPLWDLVPALDYAAWRALSVDVSQPVERMINVAFTGFTSWYLFDSGYWLAALAAVLGWRGLRQDGTARQIGLAGIVCACAFAILTLISPVTGEFVFNYRYQMTGYPLLMILIAGFLTVLFQPLQSLKTSRRGGSDD